MENIRIKWRISLGDLRIGCIETLSIRGRIGLGKLEAIYAVNGSNLL